MYSYLILIPFVFSLFSCSTKPQEVAPKVEWIVNSRSMDSLEAHQMIEAKKKFLDLTFEQVKDPYFYTTKYQPGCLEENVPGKIEEDDESLLLDARLTTNETWRIGFCRGQEQSEIAHFVWLYCKAGRKFFELRCFEKDCHKQSWKKLC